MAPKPVVTGLSPKEGPPGTKITIRGEFLGNRAEDLIGEISFFFHHYLITIRLFSEVQFNEFNAFQQV